MQPHGSYVRCSLRPVVSGASLRCWRRPEAVSVRCAWGSCVRLFAGGTLSSRLVVANVVLADTRELQPPWVRTTTHSPDQLAKVRLLTYPARVSPSPAQR
eukprot:9999707-Alexandrium_andersonii.AAC.1